MTLGRFSSVRTTGRCRINHTSLSIGEHSLPEGDRYYFYWGAQEARALSDALASEGGRACAGQLTVDLDFGSGILGSGPGSVRDGLTPEERTGDLIRFLREGSFKWTFVSRPYPNDEPSKS